MRARMRCWTSMCIALLGCNSLALAQQSGQYLEPFSGNGTIDYSTMPPADESTSYNYVSTSLMENDEKELTEEEKAREKEIAAIVQKVLKEEAEKKAKAEKEAKEKAEAEGYEVGTDLGMTATWNNGIEFFHEEQRL